MSRPARNPIERFSRWLRRAGPLRSLLLALFAANAIFFGCIQFSETMRWHRRAADELPPAPPVDRLIRVRLLGRNPRPNADLAVTSPYTLTDAVSGATLLADAPPLGAVPVRPASASGIQLGPQTLPAADILITPARDCSIVLDGQTYRGGLRVLRAPGGLIFINHVDMESYLRGVLRGELPRNFHPESFKAQCVAARTYAYYQKRNAPADKRFDVYDDESSQMYLGVRGEDRVSDAAVEETRGEVCVDSQNENADIFCTYYSSACGGLSQHVNNVKPNDPGVAPLAGNVACKDCAGAKFYRWPPVKLTKAEVTKKILARYPALKKLGAIVALAPKATTPDGRIIRIELTGSGGAKETLVGEDFRLAIGGRVLKSTHFTIVDNKDHFIFKDGKGFGHGMGLCQHGMDAKARRGMDYRAILQTYYPGSAIKKLY